jgi:hypothetical protein
MRYHPMLIIAATFTIIAALALSAATLCIAWLSC